MKRLRPLVLAGGVVLAATACTPQQVQQWIDWHEQDPAAATAFANTPEVQAQLKPNTTAHRPQPAPRQTASSGVRSSGVNWDNVARCESGGQWHHPPVTNRYGTFSGGLMIMNSAWRQFGGTQFAPLAYQASREQQIIVAERIAARVGAARAWQCPV